MRKQRNTKKEGLLHFMMYQSKGKYIAFCIDLALIREGKDPLKLKNRIERIAFKYVDNVIKNNLNDNLLNQTLPKEYINMYNSSSKDIEKFKQVKKVNNSKLEAPQAIEWDNKLPIWERSPVLA